MSEDTIKHIATSVAITLIFLALFCAVGAESVSSNLVKLQTIDLEQK